MNLTEEKAIQLGKKIMTDINFNYDEEAKITAKFVDESDEALVIPNKSWLVSFPYGYEDFGRHVRGHLIILDENMTGVDISIRNGSIKLDYNADEDKYYVKE